MPNPVQASSEEASCTRAGFLPVPLASVPPECLSAVRVYIANNVGCSLYSSLEGRFGAVDARRLLESGVQFVYVSVEDHVMYYRTMESALQTIMQDPNLEQQKKAEILYDTSLELANQLCQAPPGRGEVARAAKLVQASVQLILHSGSAFEHLFRTFGHDFYTATHMVNVCTAALALAHKLGLDNIVDLNDAGTGALLHDVGKVFIPGEILNCTEKLTDAQFGLIRTHVQRGCDHLRQVADLPEAVLQVVAEHHERLDGSGYPDRLKGNKISPMGRLAGIVDTFDAMTSVRPYRAHTFTVAQSLEELDSLPDKYDHELVHAFAAMMEQAGGVDRSEGESGRCFNPAGAKHLRYYFRLPAVMRRVRMINGRTASGPEEHIIAHRISCTNLGFLSSRPVETQEFVVVNGAELTRAGLGNLAAIVTSCRDHEDGWFTVESQFCRPHRPEDLSKLRTVTSIREVSVLAES